MNKSSTLRESLQLKTIELEEEVVAVYVPDIDGIKNHHKQQKEAGSAEPFPYWAQVWPSAIAMCLYLKKNRELVNGRSVLELGAGLGLPSVVAAKYASSVLCTDISAEALAVVKASADHNKIRNIDYRVVDWISGCEGLNADVLLLSDVNYEPSAFDQLHKVILQFLERGTTILLTTPHRLMAKSFIEKLLPFSCYKETIEVQMENNVSPILLLILKNAT